MTSDILKVFLPGFALVLVCITLFWRSLDTLQTADWYMKNSMADCKRVRQLHYNYHIILLLFILMIIAFSFFPEAYQLCLPIEVMDHSTINIAGVFVLKFSLGWIFISKVSIQNSIIDNSLDDANSYSLEAMRKAEWNLLKGMLVLFVGLFITISNIIGIVLCTIALYGYFNAINKLKHN